MNKIKAASDTMNKTMTDSSASRAIFFMKDNEPQNQGINKDYQN